MVDDSNVSVMTASNLAAMSAKNSIAAMSEEEDDE